ncbi:ubiquinol-cytochrome C chaperone family protein [Phenylobacterium montanum]|uniref:ubiquinol-cytochrome C chaperone family protein n=1 Tax=Phenylobacterium montanum TaxID=2823693 RepID=UPI00345F5586
MLQRLFRPRAAKAAGAALFQAAARQARQPAFYADFGVPDTVEGRFELYSLHVVLLVCRLKGEGAEASEVSQALFDAYLRSLDDALREMGVGDLSVGKKMRKLGEAFYGRAKAYDSALGVQSDELAALIGRTLFADAPQGDVAAMAGYVRRAFAALAELPLETILAGETNWAEIRS